MGFITQAAADGCSSVSSRVGMLVHPRRKTSMQANTADSQSSIGQRVAALEDHVSELESEIQSEKEKRRAETHALARENRELRERVDRGEEEDGWLMDDILELTDEVDELRDEVESTNPTLESGESPSTIHRPSPLVQITNLPRSDAFEHLSANEERARDIVLSLQDYATMDGGAGIILRSSHVRTYLWKRYGSKPHDETVRRIMSYIDDFAKNEAELRKHKGDNILVFQRDATEKYGAGECTPSQCDVISSRTSKATA